MTGNSQNGFTKGELCLTDLISLCDEVTICMEKKEAADVVYLDFSKACDTNSRNLLTAKLGQEDKEGKIALYVREQQEFMELCLEMDNEPVKSIRVSVTRQTNMGGIIVSICYTLPGHKDIIES